ncbi:MAG: hypothetical protein KDJ16_02815 [Hyphomicrobiales bacterium]|nr:hypothetical protein [Hyphomicrobiales bacterium]
MPLPALAPVLGFLSSPLARWLGAGLAVMAVLGFTYATGFRHADARCEAKLAAERAFIERARAAEIDRQRRVNDAALVKARGEAEALADLNEELSRKLEENAHAAANDPDRDLCGLGAGGVRRLQPVR